MGWCSAAPECRLFLHEQLAPGTHGRQSSDGRRNRLECSVPDRSAGWHRAPARCVWSLAFVVFGSLGGEYAGISNWIQRGWSWFGAQGFEYLDLGRFWQLLLIVGLVFWVLILFRGASRAVRLGACGKYAVVVLLLRAFHS